MFDKQELEDALTLRIKKNKIEEPIFQLIESHLEALEIIKELKKIIISNMYK